MSTNEDIDISLTGVDVSLGGLGPQVAVLLIFMVCFADYLIRYVRKNGTAALDNRTRTFFGSSLLLFSLFSLFLFAAPTVATS